MRWRTHSIRTFLRFRNMQLRYANRCSFLLVVSLCVVVQSESGSPSASSTSKKSDADSTSMSTRSSRLPERASVTPEEAVSRSLFDNGSAVPSTTIQQFHSSQTTSTKKIEDLHSDSSLSRQMSSSPGAPALHSPKPVTTKQTISPTPPTLFSSPTTTALHRCAENYENIASYSCFRRRNDRNINIVVESCSLNACNGDIESGICEFNRNKQRSIDEKSSRRR